MADDQTLVDQRRVVATLAAGLPGNCLLPNLVSATSPARLHALAVALHRGAGESVDDYVRTAALWRPTQNAAWKPAHSRGLSTLLGVWLVRRYFDDPAFPQALDETLQRIKALPHGDAAVEQLILEVPQLVAEEIAGRCAAAVRSVCDEFDVERIGTRITSLLRGGLLRLIRPFGYGGGGNLFLNTEILADIVEPTAIKSIDITEGVWIEAVFGVRVLDVLKRHLCVDRRQRGLGHLMAGLTDAHEASITLEESRGYSVLVYEGTISAKLGVPAEWLARTNTWRKSLERGVAGLASRLPNAPLPRCQVEITPKAAKLRISVPLWTPRSSVDDGPNATIQGLLDRHYALHLARLSRRMPTDASGSPTSTLHSALGSLMRLKKQGDSTEARWVRRLACKAIINAAAQETWSIVRLQASRPKAQLLTILEAVARTHDGVLQPFTSQLDPTVRLPETQLRLVFATLLENALKAKDVTGRRSSVRYWQDDKHVELTMDSPYVAPADYPSGLGVGFRSVASIVEFYGGELHQGCSPDGTRWIATLKAPLLEAASLDLQSQHGTELQAAPELEDALS